MKTLVTEVPRIEKFDGFFVVRDDLIEGGTKARVIPLLFDDHIEYVYPSPVQGYAQIALAHACKQHRRVATVFCAERAKKHPRTKVVESLGGNVMECRPGYLSVVKKWASNYCTKFGAKMLPWGLDCPEIVQGIAEVASVITRSWTPKEVWSVAGSGTLTRGLQLAFPDAEFHAVQVGATPNDVGRAKLWKAPERYEQAARQPPPFPSCDNYDAKAWAFVLRYASKGAMFWNVAG